ncbi:quinoprotein dehydrogenase-associated SoxYZ-like carrier [Skermanella mucosa]|uniref:quinoprotein dehydrogenase-associated SoxYZ-like carrier n=1 Tax=Skermanella mucosa TaxID=1789672 RepID=UPI001E39D5C1|nr:quinoprotein dehydrogenase-associated SoxYZ-like carrier [Skermanella mucosa]UEM23172.1 quinoprotein dehydrogenase-associated SoxYZ-like carrier [Skermanella mucosa]
MLKTLGAGLVTVMLATSAVAAEPDPLRSVMWDDMHSVILGGGPVRFDDRVLVSAPASAEDALNVPVSVDATALGAVEEIVVFADMNPIPRILNYRPVAARPTIALRLKLQQATPIRAAARTPDGVWHVGGVFVDAAGGGCTSPALAHGDPTWERHLGEVQARAWAGTGAEADSTRLRLRVRHPMDTGLAPGIPAFYLEDLAIRDADGRELARIDSFEPVSENPVFTVEVSPSPGSRSLGIKGRDNNGTEIEAEVPLPWRQSALDPVRR